MRDGEPTAALDYRAELRRQHPGHSRKTDAGSRRSAIVLHCLECVGGNRAEVTRCTAVRCFLYPFRKGTRREEG